MICHLQRVSLDRLVHHGTWLSRQLMTTSRPPGGTLQHLLTLSLAERVTGQLLLLLRLLLLLLLRLLLLRLLLLL
jgi:hypothetical protein